MSSLLLSLTLWELSLEFVQFVRNACLIRSIRAHLAFRYSSAQQSYQLSLPLLLRQTQSLSRDSESVSFNSSSQLYMFERFLKLRKEMFLALPLNVSRAIGTPGDRGRPSNWKKFKNLHNLSRFAPLSLRFLPADKGPADGRTDGQQFRSIQPGSGKTVITGRGSKPRSMCVGLTAKESSRGPASSGPPITKDVPVVIDVNPPRGTRDFPPDEMRLRSWLFNNFREVSRLFGFEEIDFPVLESEELYVRKAGEEITQQLYNFEDKGGRKVALRPELTPSLARLVIQKGKSLSLPLKWFAIGQCWRYERMTRGRRREHYQWNMDIIGVPGVEAEAELLSAIVSFFSRLGITSKDVGFRVSNRKVLQAIIGRYDIPDNSFAAVCVVVDKIEKIPRSEVEKELSELGVPAEAVDGILQALAVRSLEAVGELLGSENEAVIELKHLFALAASYGYEGWLQFDASVVRGLAYYTGTVFEAFDRAGNLRAICGGGRYDKLLSTFGGSNTPACGFGFGDAVIIELLKDRGLMPNLSQDVDDIVLPMEEQLRPQAAMVAARLRTSGRSVDLVMENKKMKWAFKHAERLHAKRLVLVGSTEWENGTVRVKDLATREESDLPVDKIGLL